MSLVYEEKVLLGEENNFMKVNHIKLKGSNYEIGKKLAEIAKDRHQVVKVPWMDAEKIPLQNEFMKKNYPYHYERMRGVASAYGMDLEENNHIDFSALYYHMGVPGCTAVYYPPEYTELKQAIFSRNFDFTTGTVMGMPPQNDEMAAVNRPYVLEIYPDEGLPSLYLTSFDLLGGCIDGINAEGLTVSILSDDESVYDHPEEPVLGSGVGVHELLIMRMVLDTCKTVEEAKKLLFSIKQFYFLTSLHYIIGDRFGNSFVFERSYTTNKEFVLHNNNQVQVITNFLLHRYPNLNELPQDEEKGGRMYSRYRKVINQIEQKQHPLTIDEIKDINKSVFWDVGFLSQTDTPPRTLWNSVYNNEERSVEISFYLRDEWNEKEEKNILRSTYFKFKLDI